MISIFGYSIIPGLISLTLPSSAFAPEGTLEWGEITSPALEGNLIGDPATRPFAVYLPPSYKEGDKRYPVIYLLHGYTGNAESLTSIKPTIDSMIQNHDLQEMIAVFVDGFNRFGGSCYLGSKTMGDYETYIARDLVNHIDASYRTIPHRESRGITGVSMGGYGSLHLALKFPEIFSAVVCQAAPGYIFDAESWKSWAEPLASVNPKDWEEFNQTPERGLLAWSAAVSPNPDKPPFFFDKPSELVLGKPEIVPEVMARQADKYIDSVLRRYLKQPVRLNGMMFVHGTQDDIGPVDQPRAFAKLLTELGVDYVYDEHDGEHEFIAEKSLQFLSDHLSMISLSTPEEVGLSSSRLGRINTLMQQCVDEKKLAGVVTLVARRGKVVHFERFGMMDIEANKPMQLDAIFRIYSMTKPITSVAAMMLYEQGRFQLSDAVSKFIPAFKNLKVSVERTGEIPNLVAPEREMTIRDLLTHTSGFPAKRTELVNPDGTLKEMIGKLAELPLSHQPGTKWEYGISTDVLGYLVEVLSGKPLDVFFEENIFKPLGMKDTGFYVPKNKILRFATCYDIDESGAIQVIDTSSPNRFSPPVRYLSGGAGLVSTASDYYRFAQMLLNGGHLDGTRLLSRKTVELMTRNHLNAEILPGFGFGLGVSVTVDVVRTQQLASEGSYWWGGAAKTYFVIDPQEDLIAIFMTQLMIPWDHFPVIGAFKTLIYQPIID